MSKARIGRLCLCLAAVPGSARAQWTEIEEAKLIASDAAAGDQFGAWVALEGRHARRRRSRSRRGGAGGRWGGLRLRQGRLRVERGAEAHPARAGGGRRIRHRGRSRRREDPDRRALPRQCGQGGRGGGRRFFRLEWIKLGALQELSAPSSKQNQRFGFAVALDGDTALSGAPTSRSASSPGEAFVFVSNLGSWAHQATMSAASLNLWTEGFGAAVALSGRSSCCRSALLGVRAHGCFLSQRDNLEPWKTSSIRAGKTLRATTRRSTVIPFPCLETRCWAGAPWAFVPYPQASGSAQIHEPKGSKWSYSQGFTKPVSIGDAEFGNAVGIDGNLVAIGAPGFGGGLVYVHSQSGSTWKQIAMLKASNAKKGARFGDTLALEGQRLVVGAPLHDKGKVYVYALVMSAPQTYCTSGTSASGCTPMISTAGQPSASAPSGFVISTTGVEGGRPGMLIYGTAGKQALPWGAGTSYLCIISPLSYGGTIGGTGTHGNVRRLVRRGPEHAVVSQLARRRRPTRASPRRSRCSSGDGRPAIDLGRDDIADGRRADSGWGRRGQAHDLEG